MAFHGTSPEVLNIFTSNGNTMKTYMLRKTGGVPIDDDFINEVRRISLRRKGLIDDDDIK